MKRTIENIDNLIQEYRKLKDILVMTALSINESKPIYIYDKNYSRRLSLECAKSIHNITKERMEVIEKELNLDV